MGPLLILPGVIWEAIKSKLQMGGQAHVHASSARMSSTLEERLSNTMHPEPTLVQLQPRSVWFSTVVEAANVIANVCCRFFGGVGGGLCGFYCPSLSGT